MDRPGGEKKRAIVAWNEDVGVELGAGLFSWRRVVVLCREENTFRKQKEKKKTVIIISQVIYTHDSLPPRYLSERADWKERERGAESLRA